MFRRTRSYRDGRKTDVGMLREILRREILHSTERQLLSLLSSESVTAANIPVESVTKNKIRLRGKLHEASVPRELLGKGDVELFSEVCVGSHIYKLGDVVRLHAQNDAYSTTIKNCRYGQLECLAWIDRKRRYLIVRGYEDHSTKIHPIFGKRHMYLDNEASRCLKRLSDMWFSPIHPRPYLVPDFSQHTADYPLVFDAVFWG
jgi:hypothetical protein